MFALHHSQLSLFLQWRHAAAVCQSTFQSRLKATDHAQAVKMGTAFRHWVTVIATARLQTARATGNHFASLLIFQDAWP